MRHAAAWLVAWALMAPAAAWSAPRDRREAEARKRCLAGDVQAGVALLDALYADTRNATYIYNQARCFQQNGRADEAIERFREYLRKARDVTPEDRRQVEAYITELELDRDARARAAPGEAVHVPAPSLPPLPPERAEVSRSAEPALDAELRTQPSLTPGGIAGIAVGATGLALIGGGVYFGLQARSLERSVQKRAQDELILDRDEERRGQRAVVYQWIGYGAGAAAVIAGAFTYALTTPANHDRVAVAPLLGDGFGAVVRAGF
jgi:hypothetical protein